MFILFQSSFMKFFHGLLIMQVLYAGTGLALGTQRYPATLALPSQTSESKEVLPVAALLLVGRSAHLHVRLALTEMECSVTASKERVDSGEKQEEKTGGQETGREKGGLGVLRIFREVLFSCNQRLNRWYPWSCSVEM